MFIFAPLVIAWHNPYAAGLFLLFIFAALEAFVFLHPSVPRNRVPGTFSQTLPQALITALVISYCSVMAALSLA